jgi:hypothetical protein
LISCCAARRRELAYWVEYTDRSLSVTTGRWRARHSSRNAKLSPNSGDALRVGLESDAFADLFADFSERSCEFDVFGGEAVALVCVREIPGARVFDDA